MVVTKSGLLEDRTQSTRSVMLFFITAAAGMCFIVYSKVLGLSPLVVTGVPVIALFVYAALMFFARRFNLRDDQSGDNLYYLGFLFTLTSLAVSLYQFSDDPKSATNIVTNFCIAIATTIVGLALRILFNQMKQDPAEVERVARLELADAASKLRSEIDTVVLELNVFQRTVQQSIMDSQHALKESIAKAIADAFGDWANVAANVRTESVQGLEKLHDTVTSVTSSVEDMRKALSDLTEQLNKVQPPEMLVRLDMSSSVERLNALISELQSRQQAEWQQMVKLQQLLEQSAFQTQESAQAVSRMAESVSVDRVRDNRRDYGAFSGWFSRRDTE